MGEKNTYKKKKMTTQFPDLFSIVTGCFVHTNLLAISQPLLTLLAKTYQFLQNSLQGISSIKT